MENKSVDHSKSPNLQDYFRKVQQQARVSINSTMPPCQVGTYRNMEVSRLQRLQQQKVNTKIKPRKSTCLLKHKSSEVTGVVVISESSNSSDDSVQVNDTTVVSNLDRTMTEADTVPKHRAEKTFASIFTKKKHLESEGTPTGVDKRHQQTQSNWEGQSIKEGSELEVTESSSSYQTVLTTHSAWREEFSGSIQKRYLGEIQESNPGFPVKRVFTALWKKYKEHAGVSLNNPSSVSNPAGAKRKRHPNETGDSEKLPKRWRYNLEEMANKMAVTLVCGSPSKTASRSSVVLPARGLPGRSRLSRTHRLREREESLCLDLSDQPKPDQPNQPDSDSAALRCHRREKHIEDLLWTDKYCPRNASEVVGNSSSVKKLHSWLKRWKLRADWEARRRRELEKRCRDNSNDSWDCGDFQGEACEGDEGEELSTTMLITGPSGVGKTASVYACALELGFKVFEVNASCQRNGRHVLTQLKEATQSHLVDVRGQALLKPTYLKNSSSTKPDTLSATETSSGKRVSSSRRFPRQNSSSRRHDGKGKEAAITLANFFKLKTEAESISLDHLSSKNTEIQTSLNYPSPHDEEQATEDQKKVTSTSLILFEEVDVVFDDDVGFLSAIKTFMSTTKRPVILTTNDPSFRATFKANFEAILFKTPSTVNTCSYLQLLCLAENIRTEPGDITSLLEVTRGDIRRSVLQVQLWGSSRDKQSPQKDDPEASKVAATMVPKSKDRRPPCCLPRCELGCTPSMLGLLNAGLSQELVNFPKFWMEPDVTKLMEVLRESWRRGVPLLYSNLELLSLSPVCTQPSSLSIPEEVAHTGPQNHPRPANIHLQTPEPSCSAPPRTSSRLSRKKRAGASHTGSVHSVLPHRTSLSSSAHSRTRSTNDKPTTLNQARRLESQSFGALADFMDLMSHLDSTFPAPDPCTSGPCGSGEFIWTGAQVKDGLLDEMREEEGGSCSLERVLEIQAALEALAFHMCHTVMWGVQRRGQDQGEESKGRVSEERSSSRQTFSFNRTSILEPGVSQKRHNMNMAVVSSRAFSTMGNRQAVAVDYLPTLRTICQSLRSQERAGGRFQHYFSRIQLGLSKSTIQFLGEDFPQ